MKKSYRKTTAVCIPVGADCGFLAGSRPIEMEADVTVTPFTDGNADVADQSDFTVSFE